MSFIAAAIIGGAALGAGASMYAGKKAASATQGAAETSAQTQMRMFEVAREDLAPYREVGEDALHKIKRVFVDGGMSEFFTSPDYQFRVGEGEKALDRAQVKAGTRYGGRALKEAVRYGQQAGSQEYGNFFNRLFQVANLGEAASAQSAAGAVNTGQSVGNTQFQGGVGVGQAYAGAAQGVNQALQGGLQNYMTLKMYNDLTSRLPAG